MSRLSVRTFLVHAKRELQQVAKREGKANLVVGNESADLDSIVCAIVYGYMKSNAFKARIDNVYTIPVTNIPAADLSLRPELTALLRHAGVQPSDLITLDDLDVEHLPAEKISWTLVDHNSPSGLLAKLYTDSIDGVIDHHDDENQITPDATPRIITKSGSCSSLVTNHIRELWDTIASASSSIGASLGQSSHVVIDDYHYTSTWDAQVAKLALGAILIDTQNLKSEDKVTQHDKQAVRYLEARINASPRLSKSHDRDTFYNELNDAKSDLDSLSLADILRKDYKSWTEDDMVLGISSVVKPIEYLQKKDDDFTSTLVYFAKQRELGIFAMMTAYTGVHEQFARQLLVIAFDDKAKAVAEKSEASTVEKLKLAGCAGVQVDGHDAVKWMRLWDQKDLAASRKQVGPLLREAMRGTTV